MCFVNDSLLNLFSDKCKIMSTPPATESTNKVEWDVLLQRQKLSIYFTALLSYSGRHSLQKK